MKMGNDIEGEAELDGSGFSVSLTHTGAMVAIGAIQNNGANNLGDFVGHVRVFEWTGVEWAQRGSDINGVAADELFGYAVSLSSNGSRLVVGAPNQDSDANGVVRTYQWFGNDWGQLGAALPGPPTSDNAGEAVAISGNGHVVAVGVPRYGQPGFNPEMVRISEWSGWGWPVDFEISPDLSASRFGHSIALSANGSRIVIGAPNRTDDLQPGFVRVYELDVSTPVDDFKVEQSLVVVYPNPINDYFQVKGADGGEYLQ